MAGAKPWTEDDLDTLRALYRSGYRNLEIAIAIGRSGPAIRGKLAVLKRREVLFGVEATASESTAIVNMDDVAT